MLINQSVISDRSSMDAEQNEKRNSLTKTKSVVDKVIEPFPKVVSPQAHALFDALAFPSMLILTGLIAKKSPQAGLLMGVNVSVEGGISLFTNYPPALLPIIPFEDHIRIGILYAPVSFGVALLMPRIPKRERLMLCLMPFVPFLLNALSKPKAK